MEKKPETPYVPVSTDLPELTFKAVFLGMLMAVVLGAANAYLGMKAGLTVAATFPAAVVAMAALRPLKGSILEENIARTTASVGEALVAGAIFTIPAFVISGAWTELHYWESTAIMLIGGVLGVLFIIVLRRTLVVEADLPFPESVAAAEIHKAGQGGQTGASFVFGAMGLAGLWELLKNSNGIQLISDSAQRFVDLGRSTIQIGQQQISYRGGLHLAAPSVSPALMGVGFIVGMRISAVLFAGAVMGWLVFVPLAMFLNPSWSGAIDSTLATTIWLRQVRPLAVGTMIVAAFYTLYTLRTSLVTGIQKAIKNIGAQSGAAADRTEVDIDFKKTAIAIGVAAIGTFLLYYFFAQEIEGALLLTVVMVVLGFLFAAVAGYLVGLIGSSNNPISGLTLSALLISALIMVAIGATDVHGVAAVLGVAGVVCCAAGIAGDMMQDLKVGHILGGTPWKMEVGEIAGSHRRVVRPRLSFDGPAPRVHHRLGAASCSPGRAHGLDGERHRERPDGLAARDRGDVPRHRAHPHQGAFAHADRRGHVSSLRVDRRHLRRGALPLRSRLDAGAKEGLRRGARSRRERGNAPLLGLHRRRVADGGDPRLFRSRIRLRSRAHRPARTNLG